MRSTPSRLLAAFLLLSLAAPAAFAQAEAIRERAGYALMPEAGTQPANHYLPRRRSEQRTHPEQLHREENPLHVDRREPAHASGAPLGADWEH